MLSLHDALPIFKLPDEVRARYDTSSLKVAIHAAAPCPVPVKQAMIDWWGPVLFEYYAGSAGNGMTFISRADWLTPRDSVALLTPGAIQPMGEDIDTQPAPQEHAAVFFGRAHVLEHHRSDKSPS